MSYNLEINSIMVDFPDPVLPKIAIVSPDLTEMLMFFRAVILVSSYVKVTSLNVIFPFNSIGKLLLFCISGTCCKNSLILACEASACCTIEVTQPTTATGQVKIFT